MGNNEAFSPAKRRLITRGINEKLSGVYQIILWKLIDTMRINGEELDYLQIFNFYTKTDYESNKTYLLLKHSQEIPEYSKTYEMPIIPGDEMVTGEIFVIDDEECSTMLWADEY